MCVIAGRVRPPPPITEPLCSCMYVHTLQEGLQRTMHTEYLQHLCSVLTRLLSSSPTPSPWQVYKKPIAPHTQRTYVIVIDILYYSNGH